jgi:hypothetical protein
MASISAFRAAARKALGMDSLGRAPHRKSRAPAASLAGLPAAVAAEGGRVSLADIGRIPRASKLADEVVRHPSSRPGRRS